MMKHWFAALVVAFQFLTRIPLPLQVSYNTTSVSRSLLFYPVVGFAIGAILYLCVWLVPTGSAPLNAALLLLIWTVLTGGLHLDGLMDTADGLGSYRSRERMLLIMKDSRVGAMGVLAAMFVLLLKWVALWSLLEMVKGELKFAHPLPFLLLSIPAISRWWMVVAIVHWPYIGGEKGLGSLFGEKSKGLVAGATVILLSVVVLLPSWPWLWVAGCQGAVGWIAARYIVRRLGGLTGDTYGAMNELAETAGLVAAVYVSIEMGG
jgi:adenosylcobinamide-GDP ribazoletransferase